MPITTELELSIIGGQRIRQTATPVRFPNVFGNIELSQLSVLGGNGQMEPSESPFGGETGEAWPILPVSPSDTDPTKPNESK